MEYQSDSEIVPELVYRLIDMFNIESWSFDMGFWHKDNKKLLQAWVEKVVMPKKGKLNKEEAVEEKLPVFKN